MTVRLFSSLHDLFLGHHDHEDIPFRPMPKIARLSKDIIVTEKIDGTNASVYIDDDGNVRVGSRTRWITPGKGTDNHGFAAWVEAHRDELRWALGPGHHFGEWYGQGINRGYGLKEKRFALFNVSRWAGIALPAGVDVVPVLYRGPFTTSDVEWALYHLGIEGSRLVPGYTKPEGVVIYHTGNNVMFKKTFADAPKSALTKGETQHVSTI